MTYPSGQTNSGPPRRFGTGGGAGAAPLSMQGAATLNTIWVDKTTTAYAADGSVQYPYNTIQAGINAAALLLPTASKPVEVIVMPGIYTEQVTLATPYVYLTGWDRETTIITAGAGIIILTVTTQYTAVKNLSFVSTAPGGALNYVLIQSVAGAWSVVVRFWSCRFTASGAGVRIEQQQLTQVDYHFCKFVHAAGNIGMRSWGITTSLYDCTWTGAALFALLGAVIYVFRCACAGSFYGLGSAATWMLYDSVLQNDIAAAPVVLSFAPTALVVKGCRFVNSLAAGYDIQADIAVTGAVIENNVMVRGIDPNVSHVNPIKHVGAAGNKDFYVSTQNALTACTYDDCTVKLLKDEALGAALLPPARPCMIDGNGKHRLTRAAGSAIVTVGASVVLTMRDLELVGSLDVTGDGALLTVEDSRLDGMIDVVSGNAATTVALKRTKVLGDATDLYAIRIRDEDPIIIVETSSQVKGVAGSPAVYYDTATNNNLKTKYSTIEHGSVAANDPFGRSGAQVPNFRAHHTAFNSIPGAGWAANLIAAAQQFNTVDPAIDF